MRSQIILPQSCESILATRFDEGTVNLGSALDHFRQTRLSNAFDEPAIQTLTDLSPPILGALAGCVNASLASGYCAGYLVKLADDANRGEINDLLLERRTIIREVEQMWCAAAPLDPEPRP